MIKRKMLPISEAHKSTAKERVVIRRDRHGTTRADQGDHMLAMWGRHPRYDFSDKDAECPLRRRPDGSLPRAPVPKKGFIVFPVNLYDHSGLRFSLGDTASGSDPGGYDTTPGAAYLYVTKKRFIEHQGKERWMKVPTDGKDWGKPWRPARDIDEFMRLTLQPIAEWNVEELNLIEEGQLYRYDVQECDPWTKTHDATGEVEQGCDWVDTADGCGGYLTEHADDIEFPRDVDITVYYDDDCFLYSDDDRDLGAYEYTIPEFIVRRPDMVKCDLSMEYLCMKDGNPTWTRDKSRATVFKTWCDANETAKKVLEYTNSSTIGELDDFDPTKARRG